MKCIKNTCKFVRAFEAAYSTANGWRMQRLAFFDYPLWLFIIFNQLLSQPIDVANFRSRVANKQVLLEGCLGQFPKGKHQFFWFSTFNGQSKKLKLFVPQQNIILFIK